jgi:hypothetical protein
VCVEFAPEKEMDKVIFQPDRISCATTEFNNHGQIIHWDDG